MTRRIATIDLGTNTVLLLVAERAESGELVPVVEKATITRLGRGVDRTRRLAEDRVAATVDCLKSYAAIASENGATLVDAVATSAMRDAAGGEPIFQALRDCGSNLRVISGQEEAELTFLGATSGLRVNDASPDEPMVVFDVGGGSTEFVHGVREDGHARIESAVSFDVGSVRLTERHLEGDPPTALSTAALAADLVTTFTPLRPTTKRVVGVAGTVTTLAAIHLELATYEAARVHGLRLPRETVRSIAARLRTMTLEDRMRVVGLEAGRADVIVAGAMIVVAAMDALDASELTVSDRGVRWGLAERALASREL